MVGVQVDVVAGIGHRREDAPGGVAAGRRRELGAGHGCTSHAHDTGRVGDGRIAPGVLEGRWVAFELATAVHLARGRVAGLGVVVPILGQAVAARGHRLRLEGGHAATTAEVGPARGRFAGYHPTEVLLGRERVDGAPVEGSVRVGELRGAQLAPVPTVAAGPAEAQRVGERLGLGCCADHDDGDMIVHERRRGHGKRDLVRPRSAAGVGGEQPVPPAPHVLHIGGARAEGNDGSVRSDPISELALGDRGDERQVVVAQQAHGHQRIADVAGDGVTVEVIEDVRRAPAAVDRVAECTVLAQAPTVAPTMTPHGQRRRGLDERRTVEVADLGGGGLDDHGGRRIIGAVLRCRRRNGQDTGHDEHNGKPE